MIIFYQYCILKIKISLNYFQLQPFSTPKVFLKIISYGIKIINCGYMRMGPLYFDKYSGQDIASLGVAFPASQKGFDYLALVLVGVDEWAEQIPMPAAKGWQIDWDRCGNLDAKREASKDKHHAFSPWCIDRQDWSFHK